MPVTPRHRGLGRRWIAILPWLVFGCADPGSDAAPRVLAVFAASSLTDAFAQLETEFERANPGVDVTVSTAGSQALRVQIEHGAPADVFASANAAHMQALVSSGLVGNEERFAEGELVIVVPPGNPAGITSLEDLPRAERIVLGAAEVPVGAYARAMLDQAALRYGPDFRARVEAHVVSLEPNVRLVLAKVELGEADAAVVYRSDATASRAATLIELPAEVSVRAQYHVGVLTAAAEPALARRFVAHLHAAAGRATLSRHGFLVD